MSTRLVISHPEDTDNGAHPVPVSCGPNWQETWWVNWHDTERNIGGFHHFGLQQGLRQADIWDWIACDGEVVAFAQKLDLPLPSGTFPDYRIGPITVRTDTPLRAYSVTSQHEETGVDLRFDAFRTPVALGVAGTDIFSHHYESMGQAQGFLQHQGRTIPISGVAFQDHSWGPRNHGAMVSHRWFWAVFGSDLYMTAYGGYNESGHRRVFGYLFENGAHHVITAAEFNYTIRDDGYTPARAAMLLTTDDGREHRVTAEAGAGQPISHHDGFLMTDALARFEYNGQPGTGLIECREIGSPAPWQIELHDPSSTLCPS